MIAVSKITQKHQTTLPKAVMEALHAGPGNQLVYVVEGGTVTLQARTGRMIDLAGAFSRFGKRPRRAFTVGELNEAAAAAWSDSSRAPQRP